MNPRTSTRRQFGLAALSTTAFVLAGCSSGSAASDGDQNLVPLTFGVAPDMFFTEYYIADDQGFFEQAGIKATLVEYPSGGEAAQAILAGQADVTNTGVPFIIPLAAQAAPLRSVASGQRQVGWNKLVARPGITIDTVDDLEGLIVAVPFGYSLDQMARAFGAGHNFDIAARTKYTNTTSTQLLPGLQSGDYDVVGLWEPNVTKALKNLPGTSIVLDSDQYGDGNGLVTVGENVYADTSTLDKLYEALDLTFAWMAENPDGVFDRIVQNTGLADDQAETVLKRVEYGLQFTDADIATVETIRTFLLDAGTADATPEQVSAFLLTDDFAQWQASK